MYTTPVQHVLDTAIKGCAHAGENKLPSGTQGALQRGGFAPFVSTNYLDLVSMPAR